MDYWCPAPLPEGQEARRKLRTLEDLEVPPAELLEGYVSDSSVEADVDEDPEVGATSATKPTGASRRTRVTAGKVSASKAEARKTAELEAEKKRKRGKTIVTPLSRPIEAEEEEEEEVEVSEPRSPSPETKRRKAEVVEVTQADLDKYKQTLITKSGQQQLPLRPPPRPLKLRLKSTLK